MLPAARSALLTLRAFCGQMAIQRIQEMQRLVSVLEGSVVSMAPAGHCSAQRRHLVQALPACGFMGTPPYSLYGRLPGRLNWADNAPDSNLERIARAKSASSCSSAASGRPAANWRMMECSAMAATAGSFHL